MTRKLDRRRLERIIDRFSKVEILVLGDVVLDEYLWGEVDRVSPEAPVPVVHLRDESTVLGGAGNVVRNIIALGGRSSFCSVVGDDSAGQRVLDLLKELEVDPQGVIVVEGRPTTRKSRVVARSQQVVRFDRETEEPLPQSVTRELLRRLDERIPDAQAAVIEDYGKGLLGKRVIANVMRRLRAAGVPVAVDPKHDLTSYRGASLLKPNLRECEMLTGVRIRDSRDLAEAVARLRRRVGPADIVVTRGSDGMTLFEAGAQKRAARTARGAAAHPLGIDVHTAAQEVFDVQGAGDTTIAALELARASGASLLEAAVIANAAAGVVVEKIGTATTTPEEVRAFLPAAIDAARRGGSTGAGR